MRFVLLCSLIFLLACREDLMHLGSEVDANRVLFALRDQGIEASKQSSGKEWLIKIEKSELTHALRVLEDRGLFQDELPSKQENSSDVFKSREEKRNESDRELARQLSSSMQLVPFVKEARVHIYAAIPEPFSLSKDEHRSASVLIVREGGDPDEQVIKELVSKGAGMEQSRVSVLFVGGKRVQVEETPRSPREPLEIVSGIQEGNIVYESNYEKLFRDLIGLKERLGFRVRYFLFILGLFLFYFLVRRRRFSKPKRSRAEILTKLEDHIESPL